MHYITALWEYLSYSNDKSLIYEVNEKVLSVLNAFKSNMVGNLVDSFKMDCHWNFYDWSYGHDGQDRSVFSVLNLLFYRALLDYKKICDTCQLVFPFDDILDNLKCEIKNSFFDKESGLFTYSTENRKASTLACSLGLLLDICKSDENESIARYLTSGNATEISLSVKCFTYDALLKYDREKYKYYVLDSIKEDYLKMVETGTVWETVKGHIDFDNAGSLCHGWSSIPIYYYHKLLK